jgi:imidazolonepropionase
VPLALASGFDPANAYNLSLILLGYYAQLHLGLSVAEVLTTLTMNAACVLNRGHRLGSIETGKDADLILLHVSDYREFCLYPGVNPVSLTIKRGQVVFDDGTLR